MYFDISRRRRRRRENYYYYFFSNVERFSQFVVDFRCENNCNALGSVNLRENRGLLVVEGSRGSQSLFWEWYFLIRRWERNGCPTTCLDFISRNKTILSRTLFHLHKFELEIKTRKLYHWHRWLDKEYQDLSLIIIFQKKIDK